MKIFSEINISVKNSKFDEIISKNNIEYMLNDLKEDIFKRIIKMIL